MSVLPDYSFIPHKWTLTVPGGNKNKGLLSAGLCVGYRPYLIRHHGRNADVFPQDPPLFYARPTSDMWRAHWLKLCSKSKMPLVHLVNRPFNHHSCGSPPFHSSATLSLKILQFRFETWLDFWVWNITDSPQSIHKSGLWCLSHESHIKQATSCPTRVPSFINIFAVLSYLGNNQATVVCLLTKEARPLSFLGQRPKFFCLKEITTTKGSSKQQLHGSPRSR